jgi:hypothetical protein
MNARLDTGPASTRQARPIDDLELRELLLKTRKLANKLLETSARLRPPGGGRLASARALVSTLAALLQFWWQRVLFPAPVNSNTRHCLTEAIQAVPFRVDQLRPHPGGAAALSEFGLSAH